MISKKDRKRIQKIIEKWRPKLFLGEWFIDIQYPNEDRPEVGVYEVIAEINADVKYMKALISVYPCWTDKNPLNQEMAIVHELCHCITQEMADIAHGQMNGVHYPSHVCTDAWERLTQRVCNVAMFGG